jgi:hypothetical protein
MQPILMDLIAQQREAELRRAVARGRRTDRYRSVSRRPAWPLRVMSAIRGLIPNQSGTRELPTDKQLACCV